MTEPLPRPSARTRCGAPGCRHRRRPAQPPRPSPDAGCRRGRVRPAARCTMRPSALPCARCLSEVPFRRHRLRGLLRSRHACRDDGRAGLEQRLFPRAQPVARWPCHARCRSGRGGTCARRLRRRWPRAPELAARPQRKRRQPSLCREGGSGRRDQGGPNRSDTQSQAPARAGHRRPQRARPGRGQGLVRRGRCHRLRRRRRTVEAVSGADRLAAIRGVEIMPLDADRPIH